MKETTLDFYARHVRIYINPDLGGFSMGEVTPHLVELTMRHWMERGLSPKSVNKVVTTLSAILKKSVSLGEISSNPCDAAERLGVGDGEVDWESDMGTKEGPAVHPAEVYSLDELKRLFTKAEEMEGWIHPLILTIGLTGMRHGEALALMWRDIDWEKGTITVRRNWADRFRNGMPVFYTPKTKSSAREIPCEKELLGPLRKWQQECPPNRWGLVFPNEIGNPHYRKTVWRTYEKLVRAAGLQHRPIHSLRHSFASIHLMMGTSIPEVAALMGHASPTITLQVYSHFLPKMRSTSMKAFTQSIFQPRPRPA